MRNKNKEIVFSNGDPMKPVFCLDGKKYYTDKDVERLIEEYDDRLRVARGNLNLVETLNSFVERDLKIARRALWLARASRANEIHFMWCQLIYDKKYGIVKFNVKKRWWAEDLKQGQTLHTPQGWADVWDEVERKCLKKAEEYK